MLFSAPLSADITSTCADVTLVALAVLLKIHDADNDGMLSKPELSDLMHMSAGQSYDERQLQEVTLQRLKLKKMQVCLKQVSAPSHILHTMS